MNFTMDGTAEAELGILLATKPRTASGAAVVRCTQDHRRPTRGRQSKGSSSPPYYWWSCHSSTVCEAGRTHTHSAL